MADQELTSLEILQRIFGAENVIADKVFNMDGYLAKVAGANSASAEAFNEIVDSMVALPNNSSRGEDYGVAFMGPKFDAIAASVIEKIPEIREKLGIEDPILEALNELTKERLGVSREWTYDPANNVYRLPYEYPPRANAPEEYNAYIAKLRDGVVSDLIEDMEAGKNDSPAAGFLTRTDTELVVSKPNADAIRDVAENNASSTGTAQEQAELAKLHLLMASQLKFVGPETGEPLRNYGEWKIEYNQDYMRDEIMMLAMPYSHGRPGKDASQLPEDLNFTLGGKFNDIARFDLRKQGREYYLMLDDIMNPLKFDENLDELQDAVNSWTRIDEQQMLDARAMPQYIRPTIRIPVPEDVEVLEKLELRDLMPKGVIPPREDGMTFEFQEREGGANVLRVPILAGTKFTSRGAAKVLSTSMATASDDQLETRIREDNYVPFVDNSYLGNKSADTKDVLLAMRDGAPLSWLDKVLSVEQPKAAEDLILRAQYVEVSGVGDDKKRLVASFDNITDEVLSIRERLEVMMARDNKGPSKF